MTERLGEKGILQPVRNTGVCKETMTHYWQRSSGPTRSTHHPVASAGRACSPALTAWGVWSRDLEPKDFSLCTALPYHQLLLKTGKRHSQKRSFKKKKKTYKLFSDSFAFFLIPPWWHGEAERHNHSLETKGKIFHCSSRKNAGWHKHQPVYFFSRASG